jgi:hypothetical protein
VGGSAASTPTAVAFGLRNRNVSLDSLSTQGGGLHSGPSTGTGAGLRLRSASQSGGSAFFAEATSSSSSASSGVVATRQQRQQQQQGSKGPAPLRVSARDNANSDSDGDGEPSSCSKSSGRIVPGLSNFSPKSKGSSSKSSKNPFFGSSSSSSQSGAHQRSAPSPAEGLIDGIHDLGINGGSSMDSSIGGGAGAGRSRNNSVEGPPYHYIPGGGSRSRNNSNAAHRSHNCSRQGPPIAEESQEDIEEREDEEVAQISQTAERRYSGDQLQLRPMSGRESRKSKRSVDFAENDEDVLLGTRVLAPECPSATWGRHTASSLIESAPASILMEMENAAPGKDGAVPAADTADSVPQTRQLSQETDHESDFENEGNSLLC